MKFLLLAVLAGLLIPAAALASAQEIPSGKQFDLKIKKVEQRANSNPVVTTYYKGMEITFVAPDAKIKDHGNLKALLQDDGKSDLAGVPPTRVLLVDGTRVQIVRINPRKSKHRSTTAAFVPAVHRRPTLF